MPSHIYSMVGLWEESIASNASAIEIQPDYYHAADFSVYATARPAVAQGELEGDVARRAGRDLVACIVDEIVDDAIETFGRQQRAWVVEFGDEMDVAIAKSFGKLLPPLIGRHHRRRMDQRVLQLFERARETLRDVRQATFEQFEATLLLLFAVGRL